jgi:hypothetical protein
MLMAVNERSVGPWARRPDVRIGAVLAVAVAAALVVWLVVIRDDSNGSSTESAQVAAIPPVAASPDRLRELSVEAGRPIYWLGPRENRTYELTRTPQDRIFVRYLPEGVEAGTREAKYTLVGTYPVDNAYGVLKELAKAGGESSFTAPKGGFAVYSTEHPTNIYLAYPGSDVQIEVYASSAEHARELITSGQVVPVS